MSKKGEFGELWACEEEYIPPEDCTGGGILMHRLPKYVEAYGPYEWIGYFEDGAFRDHAIKCVNALDGKDPEMVEELIGLARLQQDSHHRFCGIYDGEPCDCLASAFANTLAKLEEEAQAKLEGEE